MEHHIALIDYYISFDDGIVEVNGYFSFIKLWRSCRFQEKQTEWVQGSFIHILRTATCLGRLLVFHFAGRNRTETFYEINRTGNVYLTKKCDLFNKIICKFTNKIDFNKHWLLILVTKRVGEYRADFTTGCVQLWIPSVVPPGDHGYENGNNKSGRVDSMPGGAAMDPFHWASWKPW